MRNDGTAHHPAATDADVGVVSPSDTFTPPRFILESAGDAAPPPPPPLPLSFSCRRGPPNLPHLNTNLLTVKTTTTTTRGTHSPSLLPTARSASSATSSTACPLTSLTNEDGFKLSPGLLSPGMMLVSSSFPLPPCCSSSSSSSSAIRLIHPSVTHEASCSGAVQQSEDDDDDKLQHHHHIVANIAHFLRTPYQVYLTSPSIYSENDEEESVAGAAASDANLQATMGILRLPGALRSFDTLCSIATQSSSRVAGSHLHPTSPDDSGDGVTDLDCDATIDADVTVQFDHDQPPVSSRPSSDTRAVSIGQSVKASVGPRTRRAASQSSSSTSSSKRRMKKLSSTSSSSSTTAYSVSKRAVVDADCSDRALLARPAPSHKQDYQHRRSMSSSKMSHHKTRKSSYSFSSSSKRPPTSLSVATGESHYEDAVERLSTDGLSGRDGLEQESLVEEISTMLPSSSSASGQQHAMTRGFRTTAPSSEDSAADNTESRRVSYSGLPTNGGGGRVRLSFQRFRRPVSTLPGSYFNPRDSALSASSTSTSDHSTTARTRTSEDTVDVARTTLRSSTASTTHLTRPESPRGNTWYPKPLLLPREHSRKESETNATTTGTLAKQRLSANHPDANSVGLGGQKQTERESAAAEDLAALLRTSSSAGIDTSASPAQATDTGVRLANQLHESASSSREDARDASSPFDSLVSALNSEGIRASPSASAPATGPATLDVYDGRQDDQVQLESTTVKSLPPLPPHTPTAAICQHVSDEDRDQDESTNGLAQTPTPEMRARLEQRYVKFSDRRDTLVSDDEPSALPEPPRARKTLIPASTGAEDLASFLASTAPPSPRMSGVQRTEAKRGKLRISKWSFPGFHSGGTKAGEAAHDTPQKQKQQQMQPEQPVNSAAGQNETRPPIVDESIPSTAKKRTTKRIKKKYISLPLHTEHVSSGAIKSHSNPTNRESPFGRRPQSPVAGYITVPCFEPLVGDVQLPDEKVNGTLGRCSARSLLPQAETINEEKDLDEEEEEETTWLPRPESMSPLSFDPSSPSSDDIMPETPRPSFVGLKQGAGHRRSTLIHNRDQLDPRNADPTHSHSEENRQQYSPISPEAEFWAISIDKIEYNDSAPSIIDAESIRSHQGEQDHHHEAHHQYCQRGPNTIEEITSHRRRSRYRKTSIRRRASQASFVVPGVH